MRGDSFRNWNENPTLTTMSSYDFPVGNLTFPAVTICAEVEHHKFGTVRTLLNT